MLSTPYLAVLTALSVIHASSAETYQEEYRPQFHYTPAKNWMNDPNGLLYHNGVYHMYYQYNPGGITWGNMSWGHATSRDLTHWEQQPIALLAKGYPSNVTEMFFSGSAVADPGNTSGFGNRRQTPLIAMYTSYYPYTKTLPSGKTVQSGTQAQSIAYSLDEGMTWRTYDKENPVIPSPPAEYADQYENFRDPFVFWYQPSNSWRVVVSLAALHKLLIYESPNLKDWTLLSEFGPVNAVGGVWECPSIFPLTLGGTTKWVAQIGLNPGGPPDVLGSGTQYVIGEFDGTTFTADTDNVYPAPTLPADSSVFADFEGSGFASLGWNATGDLVGAGPVNGTVPGQQQVAGYMGSGLVNTFLNGDATVGTLTSQSFNISRKYINFLIGGGYAPGKEGLILIIANTTVRTATGANAEELQWHSWDVSPYIGQTAVLEIVDLLTGGWGHTNIDEISFSDTQATPQQANWMDYGPDFYAAATYNGLPASARTTIAWMNNWEYGGNIPTSPWRSTMSTPRQLSLGTVNGKTAILQTPKENWASLERSTHSYSSS